MKMRLDKFFSSLGILTRRECAAAARAGEIAVDGETVRDPSLHIDPETSSVSLCGEAVPWKRHIYLMLNKPAGTVSSTEDSDRTVMKLLPPSYERAGCFPCGRLDADTVGLLLITNDGPLAHELLAPRRHVSKCYRFRCSSPLRASDVESLENGVDIGGFVTAPAKVKMETDLEGTITVTEGKFHQIKRMMEAVGSKIVFLERVGFGPLTLDPALARGEWRELTPAETDALRRSGSAAQKK